jgi:hypothetical protein
MRVESFAKVITLAVRMLDYGPLISGYAIPRAGIVGLRDAGWLIVYDCMNSMNNRPMILVLFIQYLVHDLMKEIEVGCGS